MNRRFEKSLSLILVILIMIEFIITGYINVASGLPSPYLAGLWNISFILSWILMLIFSIYILFQKDSRGFSILVAIISTLGFVSLTYHFIVVGSSYFSFLPKSLSISNRMLLANGQIVFYTSLFIVYIFHLVNLLRIKKDIYTKEIDKENLDIEENTSDQVFLVDNEEK